MIHTSVTDLSQARCHKYKTGLFFRASPFPSGFCPRPETVYNEAQQTCRQENCSRDPIYCAQAARSPVNLQNALKEASGRPRGDPGIIEAAAEFADALPKGSFQQNRIWD